MPRKANTPEVLWSKVDKRGPDDCWPWRGFRNEQGYGRTWINDRGYYAHRVIYHLAHPLDLQIPAPSDRDSSEFLRHKCDNPPCCNPAHLVLGTQFQNSQDMVERGRAAWTNQSSVLTPRAKLTADDVFWMRMQKKYGATKKALALLYEVSEATVSGACYGRHYRDI